MAIVANLTATPVPSNTQTGAVPGTIFCHVTVTAAGGAGTYTINHNLQWTPTFGIAVAQGAEGTTPTSANSNSSFCPADCTSTVVAFNFAGNNTYDAYFI